MFNFWFFCVKVWILSFPVNDDNNSRSNININNNINNNKKNIKNNNIIKIKF